jgi:hypothetical protein
MFGSVRLIRRPFGFALAAARAFPKDATVLRILGAAGNFPTRTSVHVGNGQHVENEVARFVNHACTPTTAVVGRRLVAVRSINVGDDITFDYTLTEPDISSFSCSECGGTVAGTNRRPPACRLGSLHRTRKGRRKIFASGKGVHSREKSA